MDFDLLFGSIFFSDRPSPSASDCDSSSSRDHTSSPGVSSRSPPCSSSSWDLFSLSGAPLLLSPHLLLLLLTHVALIFFFSSLIHQFPLLSPTPHPHCTPVKPCFSFPPFSSRGIIFTKIPRLRATPRSVFLRPHFYSFFIMFELNLHLDRRRRLSGSLSREASDSRCPFAILQASDFVNCSCWGATLRCGGDVQCDSRSVCKLFETNRRDARPFLIVFFSPPSSPCSFAPRFSIHMTKSLN